MVLVGVNEIEQVSPLVQPYSRTKYLREYRNEQVTDNFYKLVFGEQIDDPGEYESIDAIVACSYLFYSFQSGKVKLFEDVVQTFDRRELNTHAQWWLNDLLLFGLVMCVSKYGKHDKWALKVLHHRADNTSGNVRDISLTFIDVLSGNWNNSANIRSISLVSHDLLSTGQTNQELICSGYESIANNATKNPKTGFLEVIEIRAFDIAILENLPVSGPFRRASKRLIAATWRFSKICAWMLWNVALILALYGLLSLLSWAWYLDENTFGRDVLDFLARIGAPLMSLLPLGLFVVKRRFIVEWLQCRIAGLLFDFDSTALLLSYEKSNYETEDK